MAQFNVTTPEAGHNGNVGNVLFADGSAVVDDTVNAAELAYFRGAGYGVTEVEPDEPEQKKAPARRAATKKEDGQ
jgi:prepilin-type processing-associated H-X9-DG protein